MKGYVISNENPDKSNYQGVPEEVKRLIQCKYYN